MDEVLQTIYIFYIYTYILCGFFRRVSIFYLRLSRQNIKFGPNIRFLRQVATLPLIIIKFTSNETLLSNYQKVKLFCTKSFSLLSVKKKKKCFSLLGKGGFPSPPKV